MAGFQNGMCWRKREEYRSSLCSCGNVREERFAWSFMLKKKARSLRSAIKMEKILARGLLNGLLNLVEKKIAASGRQVGAQKSVRFAVAHKKLDQLVPLLFAGFYLRSKCCKLQRKWVTRALT